ncbi:MAG: hypothetical protein Q9162_003630 [Coniocarpon cinnabarinum]
MSAILSESQLNDFITPGVACIKPVETLPAQQPASEQSLDPYEVTTEDRVGGQTASANQPAQISLTDCLACSGCVTSAEAVLVSLQSHEEVLNNLDAHRSLSVEQAANGFPGKIFVASVSPQARASLAATYGISSREAGCLIEQLLCGAQGLRAGGTHGSGFNWCIDTNRLRDLALWGTAKEALDAAQNDMERSDHDRHPQPKRPILASSCPGWICYAEKTHPHVLPHLSRLKSPQGLTGTLVKSVLARRYGIHPSQVWHVAVMPCFDKKLEASREELTNTYWEGDCRGNMNGTRVDGQTKHEGVRDVDCVITARELLMLAQARNIRFPGLPLKHVRTEAFPDPLLDSFLFPRLRRSSQAQERDAGPSGGYSYQILGHLQLRHPGSHIKSQRGRNPDVIEYTLVAADGTIVARTARYYGFQNIQNLVQKLQPPKPSKLLGGATRQPRGKGGGTGGLSQYLYVEVMACPGGCTNGGGQVKVGDLPDNALVEGTAEEADKQRQENDKRKPTVSEQRAWLAQVDEAYYSADSDGGHDDTTYDSDGDIDMMDSNVNGEIRGDTQDQPEQALRHWTTLTNVPLEGLLYTSYRAVESDVGKQSKASDVERVVGLASSVGGGW